MSSIVDYALQYAGRGWPIFRLSGKVPLKGSRGFKDATTDRAIITEWWNKRPDANIGLATGHGLVVLDIDGPEGLAELKALVELYGPLPQTLTARTGNGAHLYFTYASTDIKSSARSKLHVRATGGFTVLAPSLHPNGRRYEWVDASLTAAELPHWLKEWMTNGGNTREKEAGGVTAKVLPEYLERLSSRGLAATALRAIKQAESTYSLQEFERIKSALSVIPAVSYEIWYKVGMILQSLEWVRSDGTDIGLELWDDWSAGVPDKYPGAGMLEAKWQSFGRSGRGGLGLGSLFALAQDHGWIGKVDLKVNSAGLGASDHEKVNGATVHDHAFVNTVFTASPAILMPDRDKFGRYRATCRNARDALKLLQVECSYDTFAEQPLIFGDLVQQYEGSMSDPAILVLRQRFEERFAFDPGAVCTRDAMLQDAYANAFNPVLDYLDSLEWDGQPRLQSWLARYLGADHNELNAEIGAKTLVAAVRRAREPGVKFDQLVVLEGKQGSGKTSALKILAGPDHYSDQSVLAVADREQQEALRGVWIHEISELTGIRRAAVDKIKHFLSRTEDRARPAYGHFRVDLKRHGICIGTTNDDEYLKDETGNRRFWPVVTRAIDTEGLAFDRNQLWAEATAMEARGCSIEMDRRFWAQIGEIQESRTEHDEWSEAVGRHIGTKDDISISEILTGPHFMMKVSDITQAQQNRVARAIKGLGFRRYRSSSENRPWRYRRSGQ